MKEALVGFCASSLPPTVTVLSGLATLRDMLNFHHARCPCCHLIIFRRYGESICRASPVNLAPLSFMSAPLCNDLR